MEEIRIFIVEDVKEVREGLRYLLGLDSEIRVSRTFSSAEDLLEELEKGRYADIILMDIGLPGMDGIEATGVIRDKYPSIKVVMLTIFGEQDKIVKAVKAGASGYVLKNARPAVLTDQLKSIKSGGTPISPEAASKLFLELTKENVPDRNEESRYNLTAREKEILKGIAEGLTYREIAHSFGISCATVKKHILHIYRKLDVSSKVEFMKKVFNEKLL